MKRARCWIVLLLLMAGCSSLSDVDYIDSGAGANGGWAGAASGDARVDGCSAGQAVCRGSVAWTCNQAGDLDAPIDCALEGLQCADGLGCVNCVPGQGKCSDNVGQYCREDGSGYESFECDPMQGMRCTEQQCEGACTPQKLGRSHVGCDFWPVVTANSVWGKWFSFGVIVANTTQESSKVVVTRGSKVVASRNLAPSGFALIELPWVEELKGPEADSSGDVKQGPSSVLSRNSKGGGAYRVRSDQPVSVAQFNTLEARHSRAANCPVKDSKGNCLSYSNDASLLFPATSWDTDFVLMGWQTWRVQGQAPDGLAIGDFVSIVAAQDGTKVELIPRSRALGLAGQPALEAGQRNTFNLSSGDALQLVVDTTNVEAQWAGSKLSSNKGIQVITGVSCAQVPAGVAACDHLEETNLARSALANRYLVTTPVSPSGLKRHVLRVHGMEGQTVINFDPAEAHKPVTVNKGEVLDLVFEHDNDALAGFVVSASNTFGLTQYMTGNEIEPPISSKEKAVYGDPNQTVVVPVARFLRRYVFAIPPGFEGNVIDVIAATGSNVWLNGQVISETEFRAIGASGLSVARVQVKAGQIVELRGDKPLGAQVSGFGAYTSYRMPAGVDLRSSSP